MKNLYALIFLLALGTFNVHAQHDCSAQDITKEHLLTHGHSTDLHAALQAIPKGIAPRGGGLQVPVVVHVVYNTAAENLPDQDIFDMIAQLNADFSATNSDIGSVRPAFQSSIGDAGIEFCLASTDPSGNPTSGITRTFTSDTWFDPDTETNNMKSAPDGISSWDAQNYLNIWVCDITSGATGGTITVGYAYLPVGGMHGSAIDGLVIDYDYGFAPGARTATHEIGHYFGLLHPWGGNPSNPSCTDDDGQTDTPLTDGPTFSCSNTSLVTCTSLVQYENFMDYASCSVMFTAQQGSFMTSVLTGTRSSLLSSTACGSSAGPCVPTAAVGTSDGDFIDGVVLGSINNTATGSATGPTYTDYTSQSTTLMAGNSYMVDITSGDYQPDNYAAWIDYDQNGVYDSSEKLGEFQTSSLFETQSISFVVPATAMNGTTTMRVRGVYHDTGEPSPTDPCFAYTWGETEDYGIDITGGILTYCIPTSAQGTADGDYIDGVSLGSISNLNSGGVGVPTYNDFTAQSTSLIQGNSYTLDVTAGMYTPDDFAAWIDYNMDGVFDTGEKLGELQNSSSGQVLSINFTVPTGLTVGNTVMRVRGVYVDAGEPSPVDPCFDYNWGETEDYTVMLDATTGLSETGAKDVVWFQRNDELIIQCQHIPETIELIDALGKQIITTNANQDRMVLDVSNLRSGVYLLKLSGLEPTVIRVYLQ